MIKAQISRCGNHLAESLEVRSESHVKRRENDFWQRRFWEHQIRDERDFERCVDYVHYNPVKHRLVGNVKDWPYSTFHRYVRQGAYPEDWGADPGEVIANGGGISPRARCAPLYLNKCQVKCSDFGSQDAVRTLKRKACGVDLRLAVIYVRLRKRMVSQADEIVVQLA